MGAPNRLIGLALLASSVPSGESRVSIGGPASTRYLSRRPTPHCILDHKSNAPGNQWGPLYSKRRVETRQHWRVYIGNI